MANYKNIEFTSDYFLNDLRPFYWHNFETNKEIFKMDNNQFKIWMAGFYEGEGSVSNDISNSNLNKEILEFNNVKLTTRSYK